MIKIENVEVFGWEAAIRGMRNPKNSWDKSDSVFGGKFSYGIWENVSVSIGNNDIKRMKSLSKAGTDHGKFLRMINVTMDITAPLYWWKEFDTYKIGTVCNSCSTMHKIQAKEFTLEDFSCEHLQLMSQYCMCEVIRHLNNARSSFLRDKDKNSWWQMIQLLPSSYNQKRTVQLNYQVLKAMYFARKNHKLDEWREFCKWCETLPYFSEICINPD
jgi:hypothetical protein